MALQEGVLGHAGDPAAVTIFGLGQPCRAPLIATPCPLPPLVPQIVKHLFNKDVMAVLGALKHVVGEDQRQQQPPGSQDSSRKEG